MTIKDVQRIGSEVSSGRERPSVDSEEYFLRKVLGAIADSDCQDSPAELAAEALKVLEPPRATSTDYRQSDAHLGAKEV